MLEAIFSTLIVAGTFAVLVFFGAVVFFALGLDRSIRFIPSDKNSSRAHQLDRSLAKAERHETDREREERLRGFPAGSRMRQAYDRLNRSLDRAFAEADQSFKDK